MKYMIIMSLLTTVGFYGQNAFKNFGNMQLHSNAEIGFHTDIINDGQFDNNQGSAGIYSDLGSRSISGQNIMVFNNVDIDVQTSLDLMTSLGVKNDLLFVNGKVITPRNSDSVSLNFINHNLYVGEDNERHVDGYASVTNKNLFTFPIGHDGRLRPMSTSTTSESLNFKGAYFYENPNLPSSFSDSFSTIQKQPIIETVTDLEFWDLNGETPTQVTLTWDTNSNISNLSNNVNNLRVVGWNKTTNQWEELGNTAHNGDLNQGQLTSLRFVPNDYEIITIGSVFSSNDFDEIPEETESANNNNFLISPNGDEMNDALVFNELIDEFTNSELTIVNRWGNLVYQTIDYKNNWKGLSNGKGTIDVESTLPSGTYFYTLKYGNGELTNIKQGWVYINR